MFRDDSGFWHQGAQPTVSGPIQGINERTFLSVFEGVPMAKISKSKLAGSENICDLLSAQTDRIIFKSKGEARRLIQGGGLSVNKTKVLDPNAGTDFSLIKDKYLLVQKGKKNYYIIKVLS